MDIRKDFATICFVFLFLFLSFDYGWHFVLMTTYNNVKSFTGDLNGNDDFDMLCVDIGVNDYKLRTLGLASL